MRWEMGDAFSLLFSRLLNLSGRQAEVKLHTAMLLCCFAALLLCCLLQLHAAQQHVAPQYSSAAAQQLRAT